MNTFKGQLLNQLSLVTSQVMQKMEPSKLTQYPFFGLVSKVLEQCIVSIKVHSTIADEGVDLTPSEEGILKSIVKFVSTNCTSTKFYKNVFETHYKTLILDGALWLIKAPPKELKQLQEDPIEFVRYAMDCADKQKSGTLKSDTIRLIENICDHTPSALQFTAYAFIEMMEVAFNSPTKITSDVIANT